MQRDKVSYPIVKKYRPFLFWEECRFCNKEFKKENGFIIRDFKVNRQCITYCCSKCAKSIEEVKKKIDETGVYPARVKFRGFDEKSNTEGYINVSKYINDNSTELLKESRE